MFGKSMDSLPKIGMGGDSDSESSDSSSSAPVTRAEFDALAARVAKCEEYVDQDEQDDEQGDDDSSDSMASTSIAGASNSVKPSPAAKKMVGMFGAKPSPFKG